MKIIIDSFINFIRKSWLAIGASILILILLEGLLSLGVKFGFIEGEKSIIKGTMLDEASPIPESYKNAPWFKDYAKEASHVFFNVSWRPYVYWKTNTFKGQYINISDDSTRKTWAPSFDLNKPLYEIFIFGGSTLWGWGARDDQTIPSLISKILYHKYNIQAKITNFGELGYINTQEIILFFKDLQQNKVPQVVVFYDGLNDVFTALQSGIPGVPQNEFKREKEFKDSIFRKLFDSFIANSTLYKIIFRIFGNESTESNSKLLSSENVNQLADQIVNLYLANMKIVKSLSNDLKIKSLFYWQPIIFTKNDLTPSEKDFSQIHLYSKPLYLKTNEKINAIKENNFYNISNILSGHKESFYIDPWHIDEKGNEIIANKIAEDIYNVLNVP